MARKKRGRPAEREYPLILSRAQTGLVKVTLRKKTANSTWQGRFSTPDAGQTERSLGAGKEAQALTIAKKLDGLLIDGAYDKIEALLDTQKRGQQMTLRGFIDGEFRPNYAGWSKRTQQGATGILSALIREFGDRPLNRITTRMLDDYLSRREEGPDHIITRRTRNRYAAAMKTIFRQAVIWGRNGHDPARDVRIQKEPQKEPHPYSEAELEQLLAKLPPWAPDTPVAWREVCLIALDTGMRRSELRRLTWECVDFDQRTVTVRERKNRDFTTIPMTDRVYDTLQGIHERNGRSDASLPVLPFTEPTRVFRQLEKATGIQRIHLHRFRDTFATRLLDRGVPLDRVQKLLGHKDISMTLRYAKTREEKLREAIETLNE